MKTPISNMRAGLFALAALALAMVGQATAAEGVLYGKQAVMHKVKTVVHRHIARHRDMDRLPRYDYFGHGRYRCIANCYNTHRHGVVRKYRNARHVADIALVKAAYIRRPGGKWRLVRARVKAGRIWMHKRRYAH